MAYTLVWFKRDLRVHDHAPLLEAARRGPVLCLYVIEPGLWQQPDMAAQHLGFVRESLRDLDRALQALGSQLMLAQGDMVQVLDRLHATAPFAALHAHEETGNGWTYARDLAVARWCRAQGVAWREWAGFGVVRGLRQRERWAASWEAHMALPCWPTPTHLQAVDPPASSGVLPFEALPWPSAAALGLDPTDPPARQRGGRRLAEQRLARFANGGASGYRRGMSSPLTAPSACSRLSADLAYGGLSLREVVQTTRRAMGDAAEGSAHRQGLQAFLSRLYWHCHFIQKLESEPALESHNLHRGYDGLREDEVNAEHLAALMAGRTGWPMVDACVAMLRETGWLNFRMRAMLVSVAAYPLWLHWRPVGLWLARQFLDYEPGIHWSQLQMQSGTTGINTTRVYNPIKQAMDHDPQGRFVRRWLPALRRVPDSWLWEPWRMPADMQARLGLQPGEDLPTPPVDLAQALQSAKARLHARRREPAVRAAQGAVVERHASRRGMPGSQRDAQGQERAVRRRRAPQAPAAQLSLDWSATD